MRLRIRFTDPEERPISLPCQYNELIQGFIYSNLDEWLARKVHDQGFVDISTKRAFKLFTFSRLLPEKKAHVKDGRIRFFGTVSLIVCSPLMDFIESFATNLLKSHVLKIGLQRCIVLSVEIESQPEYSERLLVRTLSPITVYSTFETQEGKRKTYYYSPFEKDFDRLLLENLKKKLRSLKGLTAEGGSIKPVKVSSRDERIILYKQTVIKGWDGVFEMRLPPPLFEIAFDCGLGAKNSQGFGCIEAYNGESEPEEE